MAIKKYNEVLLYDSRNESALLNLSIALWRKGDIRDANTHLEELTTLYPNYEWAREIQGELLLQQEDFHAAVEVFRENIEYNYKFFRSYISLSNAYQALGNDEDALTVLKRCIWLNPFYREAYEHAAIIYQRQGKDELADKLFERAGALK